MRALLIALLCVLSGFARAQALGPPSQSRQLVLAVGTSTDASAVKIQRYARADPGAPWRRVGESIPGRIGKKGMAWGLGLHGVPSDSGRSKREGDWRAPMGVFRIGRAFGDAAEPPAGTSWSYTQVTQNDLWVEDASAPSYNTHVRVPADRPRTEWEESQRMKMGDPAHQLKIVIEHNTSAPVVPGSGSAIFFHIWRGEGTRPTSGCTAMSRVNLEALLGWLSADAEPVYVLTDARGAAQARNAGTLP